MSALRKAANGEIQPKSDLVRDAIKRPPLAESSRTAFSDRNGIAHIHLVSIDAAVWPIGPSQALQDQAGTKPRTTRNIMGNDRGPSGKPTRYPARTCCSIEPRAPSESAINMPVTLPGPSVNVAQ